MRGRLSEGATAADESASPHWAGRAANLGCAVHSTSGLPQIRLREAKERNQPVAPLSDEYPRTRGEHRDRGWVYPAIEFGPTSARGYRRRITSRELDSTRSRLKDGQDQQSSVLGFWPEGARRSSRLR